MNKIFTILFILISNLVFAQGLIFVKNNKQVIDIAKHVSILEDPKSNLTIQDILESDVQISFEQNAKKPLSFGFSQSTFWMKFSVLYQQKEPLALKIKNVLLDTVQLYIIENKKVSVFSQAGLLIPFADRDVNTNCYIFDLPVNPSAISDIYIRVNSKLPVEVFASLGKKDILLEENAHNKLLHGMFVGFLVLIISYNLLLYFSVKDIGFLLYVFSCICVGLSFLVFQGFLFEYIFPNHFYLNKYINTTNVTCFAIIANIAFSMQFLRVKRYFKLSYFLAFALIFILLLLIFLNLIGYHVIAFVGSQFTFLILAVLGIYIPVHIYNKGFKPARLYLYAWIGVIIGGMIDLLKANQFLPANDFTNHAYQIGTALEMLLLSLALADKINIYKEDKEKARQDNLVLVEENLELTKRNLYLIKEQNLILEGKVKERTIELQSANREILEQNEELHAQERELMIANKELVDQKELIEMQNEELHHTSYRLNTSIRYAKEIQEVILPEKEKLNSFFAEHFTIYLPKDIVAGDFYWFVELGWDKKWKKENQLLLESINPSFLTYKAILAVVDCTGHGVPGAFMSMIVHTLLHEIVEIKKITNPSFILQNLHTGIKNLLKQSNGKNSDGMDISICFFEKDDIQKEYKVTFAGAKGLVFYTEDNQIRQFNSNRYSIGGSLKKERKFTNQEVTLKEGSLMYFITDGYIDQNNVNREKFGSNNFKLLLNKLMQLPIPAQERLILSTLKEHQGSEEQRDDISVIGIKL